MGLNNPGGEKGLAGHRGRPIAYLAVLCLFALLYSAAHFPGLEYTTGYAGFTYKILHPESFPGDPYFTAEQPTFLTRLPEFLKALVVPFVTENPTVFSLYTVFVKLVGKLALDDRFNFAVYMGLALCAIWAVERITRLFGLNRLERLTVIAVLLLEHSFKDHIFQLVSSKNYNPTTFAYPPAIWVGYFMLRGGSVIAMLILSILGLLISLKTAWFPAFVAILLALRKSQRLSWGIIASGVMLTLAALFGLYALGHGANVEEASSFDISNATLENSESNPFLEGGAGNVLYVLLLMTAMWVKGAPRELTARIRVICTLSLLVFFGGGLYYTFAPDPLKIPFLLALGVNRTTWWPSLIIWIVFGVEAIRRLREPSATSRALGCLILILLFGAPWLQYRTAQINPAFLKKTALVLLSVGTLGFLRVLYGRMVASRERRMAFLHSVQGVVLASVIVASAVGLVRIGGTRLRAFEFLIEHGIMGDAPAAKWVGINEYLRNETSPSASVLALVTRDYPWRPEGLLADGSLRIRAGRRMPLGCELSIWLNYEKVLWHRQQMQYIAAFVAGWDRQDVSSVSRVLVKLGEPDYLVIPIRRADWLTDQPAFPYHMVKTIGEFVILRKRT